MSSSTPKSNWILFFIVVGLFAIYYFQYYYRLQLKLDKCSVYTVAKVTEIKYRKRSPWFVYEFSLSGTRMARSEPAKRWVLKDIGVSTDVKALLKRRFWVQVSCEDSSWYKLNWDIEVPDTLQNIPINGWRKLPNGLKFH